MNDKNRHEPKADDLIKPVDVESIELTEEDLERVSGGSDSSLDPGIHFKYDPR
jgi:hypothetical protein